MAKKAGEYIVCYSVCLNRKVRSSNSGIVFVSPNSKIVRKQKENDKIFEADNSDESDTTVSVEDFTSNTKQ